MIERDVGDDAEAWLDYVCGIETAAHADFEHDHVGTVAGEILEGHRGQHLEKAGMPGQIAFGDQALGGAIDYVVEPAKSSSPMAAPLRRMRSLMRTRCGEV